MTLRKLHFFVDSLTTTHALVRSADPNGILAFTVKQLQEAEDAGQRVWLVAHMPPGRQDALNDQVSPSAKVEDKR